MCEQIDEKKQVLMEEFEELEWMLRRNPKKVQNLCFSYDKKVKNRYDGMVYYVPEAVSDMILEVLRSRFAYLKEELKKEQ